jgi:hypothetical protein
LFISLSVSLSTEALCQDLNLAPSSGKCPGYLKVLLYQSS